MQSLVLKPGKSRVLQRRHPWVFSGALRELPEWPPGTVVDLVDERGQFLARGFYNRHSQIAFRVLTWDGREAIDAAFFARRIAAAWERRKAWWQPPETTAVRAIMSDADGLPGLIVDRYEGFLVVQLLTAGMEHQRESITQGLVLTHAPLGIYERSDDAARKLEGLSMRAGLWLGEEPPAAGIAVKENGTTFLVDARVGHKTGHYCDQRVNRALVAAHAKGRTVVDAFCNSGGFTLQALRHGAAHVTSIDSSQPALAQLGRHLECNGLADATRQTLVCGDVFTVLRELAAAERRFGMIVLDPPKFAATAAQVERAARGYKDINLLAAKCLEPGGILATFSCSGHISADLFQKIVFGALSDARRDGWILEYMVQAPDHLVRMTLPESMYLKGLLIRME